MKNLGATELVPCLLYIFCFIHFLPILAVITKKQETTTSDMKMNTTEAKVYRNIHFLNCLKKTFFGSIRISLSLSLSSGIIERTS